MRRDLLAHLDHPPLPVHQHDEHDRQVEPHRALHLTGVHAECTIAGEYTDPLVRCRDGRTQRLPHPGTEHAELERRQRGPRDLGIVVEVRPHCRVAAVEDPDRVLGHDRLRDRRDVCGMDWRTVAGQRLVEFGAFGVPLRTPPFQRLDAHLLVGWCTEFLHGVGQCPQRLLGVGEQGHRDRLVHPEPGLVVVDLNGRLRAGFGPVRSLAPPVGLTHPGAHDQCHIRTRADLVVDRQRGHRDRLEQVFRKGTPGSPGRGHRCGEQLRQTREFRLGARVVDTRSGVDHRLLGVHQHLGGFAHQHRIGLDRGRAAVALRRTDR